MAVAAAEPTTEAPAIGSYYNIEMAIEVEGKWFGNGEVVVSLSLCS